MKNKSLVKSILIILIALFLGVVSCFFLSSKKSIYSLIILFLLYGVLAIFYINKFEIEKSIIMLFILFIPFMTELKFNSNIDDYHVVAKMYYTFNYLHLFCIYFLVKILKNIKRCKIKFDLILLFIFNLICIISISRSINPLAGLCDYIRYVMLTILYIYFSRIFDYKKYKNTITSCLVISLGIQLIIGILQIIKGNRLGLQILGEGENVFRLGVTGYERGFSGTFGHPGPMALYANIILIMLLFDKGAKKIYRLTGIILSTIITIVAAGRTSIIIMILVYVVYFILEYKIYKLKDLIIFMISGFVLFTILLLMASEIRSIINRFINSDINQQFSNRIGHILVGLYYIKQKPLLGLGLNNYLDYTYKDFPLSFSTNFFLWNPIHNSFIQYAVEIGILGAIILYYFLLNNIGIYFKMKNKLKKSEKSVLIGSIIVIFVWIGYGLQGWGGIQTRSLMMLFLNCSLIVNKYLNLYKV